MADTDAGGRDPGDRFRAGDGTLVYFRRWKADPCRGAVNIVHGMAEHGLRYDRLARGLCAAGFDVWAADMRGHGLTADPARNDPGRGGKPGHCGDSGAVERIMGDLATLNGMIRDALPGRPLFMLGHSWGSFLVQRYVEEAGDSVDGCVLSGTRGPGGAKVAAGALVMALIALATGPRRPSGLSRALCDGAFNRPFRPNRTPFDWLSREEAEVDAYAADPASGVLCSAGFYRDLTALLARIHRPDRMAAIRKDLPVYVYAGSADPVGDMGAGPTALVAAYRALGIGDLEFVLYPGGRHEMHNETNREEVTANLIAWLRGHSGGEGA